MSKRSHIGDTYSIWDKNCRLHLLSWSDPYAHRMFFYQAVLSYENPVVIELGVREATSTRAFLAGVHDAKGKLYSCDIDPAAVPAEWLTSPEWVFIQGDDISESVLARMPGKADIVFIDTLHTYEHAYKELEAYVPRVNPGGMVLLHDTELNEAVNPGCRKDDVYRAMTDYCSKHDLPWENYSANWGLGIIWV